MICYRCKVQFVRYKSRYPKIQNFAGSAFLCKLCYDAIERYIDGDILYVKDSPETSKAMGKRLVDDKPIIQPDEDGQCPHFIYDCYCGLPDGITPK